MGVLQEEGKGVIVFEGWHHQHLVLVGSLPHMLELLRHRVQVGSLVVYEHLRLGSVFL